MTFILDICHMLVRLHTIWVKFLCQGHIRSKFTVTWWGPFSSHYMFHWLLQYTAGPVCTGCALDSLAKHSTMHLAGIKFLKYFTWKTWKSVEFVGRKCSSHKPAKKRPETRQAIHVQVLNACYSGGAAYNFGLETNATYRIDPCTCIVWS